MKRGEETLEAKIVDFEGKEGDGAPKAEKGG